MKAHLDLDTYEQWGITVPSLPSRSVLYPLEPVGLNTPEGESLTSYLVRLAQAHGVIPAMLMEKIILPRIRGDSASASTSSTIYKLAKSANATSVAATRLVDALESLTQRRDLRWLTLLPWKEMFPVTGLARQTKAWCETCYEEWQATGHPIYDLLLWTFQEITVCVRHRQYLRVHCPHLDCRRPLHWIAWKSRPGYCSYCHRWLGRHAAEIEVGETLWVWQQWVVKALGELLARASMMPMSPTRETVTALLTQAVQSASGGNGHTFARLIAGDATSVNAWLLGKRLPQLKQLLRSCYASGMSLSAWLFDEDKPARAEPVQALPLEVWLPALPPLRSHPSVQGSKYDTEEVRLALEQVLKSDEKPFPSMKEVARRLGYQYASLVVHYPETCHAISARYAADLQRQKREREQRLREEIRQIAMRLHAEGEELSPWRLMRALDKPGRLLSPFQREAFYEILRELETEDVKQIAENQRLADDRQSL